MKCVLNTLVFFLILQPIFGAFAVAQSANETNQTILMDKLKADKKLVVATNMELNDQEAKKFWPLYDEYQVELEKINQQIGKLIEDYANAYNSGTISNETAGKLIKEWLTIEAEEVKIRVANVNKMAKVLPATTVARYLQIENKIRTLLRMGMAEGIPLMY